MSNFKNIVFDIVRKIPRGQTMTYKEVAVAAGRPNAYRAVGNVLNTNFDPEIPCHRVVRSDGRAGGYNRGEIQKQRLLEQESAYPQDFSQN